MFSGMSGKISAQTVSPRNYCSTKAVITTNILILRTARSNHRLGTHLDQIISVAKAWGGLTGQGEMP
jgi:hypothetical protein